jgi:hypothetical protein
VNKNHPDCGCKKEPTLIKHYLGIQVGDRIIDVEGVEEIGGKHFLNKIDTEIEKEWDAGQRFCLPSHLVPKYWTVLTGETFRGEAQCEILFKTASLDEFFANSSHAHKLRTSTFQKLEEQAGRLEIGEEITVPMKAAG